MKGLGACIFVFTVMLSACDESSSQRQASVRNCAIAIRYQAQHTPSQILYIRVITVHP